MDMRGSAGTATRWKGPSPSSKVATVHQVVGWVYVAIALLFALLLALSFGKPFVAARYLTWLVIAAVLAAAHLLVYRGALAERAWAKAGSLALGVFLFLVFPIFGWILGVYVIANSAKPWESLSA